MKHPKNTAGHLEPPQHRLFPALFLVLAVFFQACSTTRPNQSRSAIRKPFESDGCTCVPNGPSSDPDRWRPACEKHDRLYWVGGTRRERLLADRQLKAAIKESGNPLTAEIYFIGVRFGGSPWFPTPWRWGFGRKYPAGYQDYPDTDS